MALEMELGDPVTQRSREAEGQLCSQAVETLKSEGGRARFCHRQAGWPLTTLCLSFFF